MALESQPLSIANVIDGKDGQNGQNGVSVIGTQAEYVLSNSGNTPPSSGWVDVVPSAVAGMFMWTRLRNALSDGTFTDWVYTVNLIGRDAVIVSSAAPSNPVVGTLWQKPSDPTVLEWTGSDWVTWGLSLDNIVVDNATIVNGRFQRLDGVEIYASIFGGDFQYVAGNVRPDIPANQVTKTGTMTLSGGELQNDYITTNTSTGEQVGYGRTILDPTRLVFDQNIGTGVDKGWYLAYTIDGIQGRDYRNTDVSIGLDVNDMIRKRNFVLTPASGFASYGQGQDPTAERHGRLVELSGAFKNNNIITSANQPFTVNSPLPVWARPRKTQRRRLQGSGMSGFLIEVNTDGTIVMSRYGVATTIDVPAGAWLNIGMTYSGQDVFESGISI